MPFYSAGDGDLKTAFVSDAWFLERFVGNTLFTWGLGTSGQRGDNTAASQSTPNQTITRQNTWVQVSCSYRTAAAIKTDGTLWCWGNNPAGMLGDNTITGRSSPVQTVTFATNWKQVFCGLSHMGAIKTDGTLWIWGNAAFGCHGDNTSTNKSSPVQTIAYGNSWKQIACGASISAAIKTDGTLWTWGLGTSGQLGDNTATSKSSPVQTVTFATNWKQVSCGYRHMAAIKNDGTLWCWGQNTQGELGDNTVTTRSSPVQTVTFATNWKQVACGYRLTAAIKYDGTLWTWGLNTNGQIGDNTVTKKSSPVQTISYGTNWKYVGIHCYSSSVSAIKNDGTLWLWGNGSSGSLGDNTIVSKSSPVQTTACGTNWKQSCSCTYATNSFGFSLAVTNGDI